CRLWLQCWPELLQHLLTMKPEGRSKREELHQTERLAQTPFLFFDQALPNHNAKRAEKIKREAASRFWHIQLRHAHLPFLCFLSQCLLPTPLPTCNLSE